MFFRRVFSRKEPTTNGRFPQEENIVVPPSPHRNRLLRSTSSEEKRGLSVLQLTPLWEHIIRTKSLPSNVNEIEMFGEFIERLRDPEWQVRQHALRVLVDVLIVMKQSSDQYFAPLIRQLVENLGHAAPAIRKGALDVLKVYMSETAMAETVLLEIIDIGMEQKKNDPLFGRLCVGVMLSLPSLVQTCIHTSKRDYILKAAIEALTNKMVQVTYQEVALKVLLRIRELIGAREFSDHIAHGAYREFELLCNVYGLPRSEIVADASNDLYISTSAGGNRTWQVLTKGSDEKNNNSKVHPTELSWKSTTDEDDEDDDSAEGGNSKGQDEFVPIPNSEETLLTYHANGEFHQPEDGKVIMETEINIENTAVTMRILEQDSSHETSDGDEEDINSVYEHSGIVRVLTDSELEEINNINNNSDSTVDYLRRTPRRVTFGGEIVKMRTPDSDSITQSDVDDMRYVNPLQQQLHKNSLRIDIPNDNTKPASRPLSAVTSKSEDIVKTESTNTQLTPSATSPASQHERNKAMLSPAAIKRARRLSVSPVEEIISATPPHKEIEVLHNLQRSPLISPTRISRRNSSETKAEVEIENNFKIEEQSDKEKQIETAFKNVSTANKKTEDALQEKLTWEDLVIVDEVVIKNLKSGVSSFFTS